MLPTGGSELSSRGSELSSRGSQLPTGASELRALSRARSLVAAPSRHSRGDIICGSNDDDRIPVGKLYNDRYVPLHPHLYARIADRGVADEYNAVSAKVEGLYRHESLPGDAEGPNMRRVRSAFMP